MPKMMSINCRVMFGQNIVMQKKPINCAISVKADGSDSIQDIKIKIAVNSIRIIFICAFTFYIKGTQAHLPSSTHSEQYLSLCLELCSAACLNLKSWQSFHRYVESFCNLKE